MTSNKTAPKFTEENLVQLFQQFHADNVDKLKQKQPQCNYYVYDLKKKREYQISIFSSVATVTPE